MATPTNEVTELVCSALEKDGKYTCFPPSLRCAMRQVSNCLALSVDWVRRRKKKGRPKVSTLVWIAGHCVPRMPTLRPLFRPDVAALLRLCGQPLPENSVNHLKLLANIHYDHFSRPCHHSFSKIRMKIATSIQHITFPANPPTRAVWPFSSIANFGAPPMQPGLVSLAAQILHS